MKTLAGIIITLAAVAASSLGCNVSVGAGDPGPLAADGAAVCSACVGPLAETGGACASSLGACGADQVCSDWLTCTHDCLDGGEGVACYDTCGQSHAGASALWGAVKSCVCGHCSAACDAPTSDYCSAP